MRSGKFDANSNKRQISKMYFFLKFAIQNGKCSLRRKITIFGMFVSLL